MSEYDLVVRGRCVYGDEVRDAAVAVRDGRIAAIAERPADLQAVEELHLADDEVLLPGLVDTHVHVNEPGRTEWEGFATATRAAAAGGITTIIDMPLNCLPPTTDPDALAVKRTAAAGQCHVDVGFWGGAVPGSLGHLGALHEQGVFGVKCFLLDSGVPEFPPLEGDRLDRAMAEVADYGGLLIAHCEDPSVVAAAPAAHGTAYADFLASRPPEAEDRAIETLLSAAARHRTRVHVVHLSSAASVGRIREARADGVPVTTETCPHYLTLAAAEVPDGHPEFKCCPPVRDAANRDSLWEALAAGDIDAVVSDHSPCPPALKCLDTGDFGDAWGGIASLQLGLPLVLTEARNRGHTLTDVVRWMGRGPAAVIGLDGKGGLAVGNDADLVVFAPDETWTVDPDRLQHRHSLTPYAGRELTGVVRRTYLRGTLVHQDVPVGPARGRFLRLGESR